MDRLDRDWLEAHPLPAVPQGSDKNARGRVLVVGGAEFVPGALRLTAEAALRAGAGKVQLATVRSAAIALAVLMPEAALIPLPADDAGEIAAGAAELLVERIARVDALVLGPGMSARDHTAALVEALLVAPRDALAVVLDAAALTCSSGLAACLARHGGRLIMTPHHGEMGYLLGRDEDAIAADPEGAATEAAERFHAVVLLKGITSVLAAPGAPPALFDGGCVGLGTAGSGDVLAGIVGGLAARGASPLAAAGWGAWLHGAAGRRLSETIGPMGFLARELVPLIPRLIAAEADTVRPIGFRIAP